MIHVYMYTCKRRQTKSIIFSKEHWNDEDVNLEREEA